MKILYIYNNLNCNLGFDQINNLKFQYQIRVLSIWGSGSQYLQFKNIDIPCYLLTNFKNNANRWLIILIKFFAIKKIINQMRQVITDFSPNLVISNLYLSDILVYLAMRVVQNHNIKFISIQHDKVSLNPIIRFLKIRALKHVDGVIAISESAKHFLISYFKVSENKIKVIYNGIEIDKFMGCIKDDTNQNLVFGTVARLDKIKGHIYTLQALDFLKKKYNLTPRFIFVGDGPERTILESYTSSHNLNNVEFVGQQIDVRPYLAQIDVFILPSLSEGLGVSIIEAMTAAKCVIATNIDGIKELITTNETGFLLEPQDSNAICTKMKWCLDNPESVRAMGMSAQRYILDNRDIFDIKNSVLKYETVFKELVTK